MTQYLVAAGGQLQGTCKVPGDKSVSHRSIMLGSIASGTTEVTGFLEGEDALATMNAFRAMGVSIEGPEQGRVVIHGVGKHGLNPPQKMIDCGNSGTTMRLLSGLLCGQGFEVSLTGDSSLQKRPMARVATPLGQMGAQVETSDNGRPPLTLKPVETLKGMDYTLPVASAQVKSAVLLAGLYASGETSVTEPLIDSGELQCAATRDHSERMLQSFGVKLDISMDRAAGTCTTRIQGGQELVAKGQPMQLEVPADISSAAFFLVGASISPGSDLLLTKVGINPTRVGVLEILRLMGANIELVNQRMFGGEPVADIRVRYAPLKGIEVPPHLVPLAIDEFPVLFIAAATAQGRTLITNAAELRVKESDRIQVMADGMKTLGIAATPTADGMIIEGSDGYGGGVVDSHGDHRIAMAFAMAALRSNGPIRILDCANVATSFPGFDTLARNAGLSISVEA
jgi:3-phosphoshikimate 1-carboxyvinyltransferase